MKEGRKAAEVWLIQFNLAKLGGKGVTSNQEGTREGQRCPDSGKDWKKAYVKKRKKERGEGGKL